MEALKYDRLAIADGEWWRLASGHLTHLGLRHLALNLAGLVLVWMLVGRRLSGVGWLLAALLGVIVIDSGFWFLDQQMLWYVGLSGLLHGFLVTGALAGLAEARGESVLILLLVLGKIVYEQLAGPLPGSEWSSGGPVVVNAHLYGAAGGVMAGLPLVRGGRGNARI